jgi:uncharacterized DUF497 family protein
VTLASDLEWDALLAKPDRRRDYGETRMIGYAPAGAQLFCVVFTNRGDMHCVISLRKANEREGKRYANQI